MRAQSGLAEFTDPGESGRMMFARPENGEAIPIWGGDVPYAQGEAPQDIPTLTAFWPMSLQKKNGPHPAVVICPGGGYNILAPHEGEGYARWLSIFGICCFVLKYRLASDGYRHPVPMSDATRALRLVRAHAGEWALDPNRIGIMGSSAGGHLAATAMTLFDAGDAGASDPVCQAPSRPDFGILCYPVITMGEHAHIGCRNNLLGPEADNPELHELLSTERQVKPDSPPAFIWNTVTDPVVPPIHSRLFAEACEKAGVSYELHLYDRGSHGIGLDNGHPWSDALLTWLRTRGIALPVTTLQAS